MKYLQTHAADLEFASIVSPQSTHHVLWMEDGWCQNPRVPHSLTLRLTDSTAHRLYSLLSAYRNIADSLRKLKRVKL